MLRAYAHAFTLTVTVTVTVTVAVGVAVGVAVAVAVAAAAAAAIAGRQERSSDVIPNAVRDLLHVRSASPPVAKADPSPAARDDKSI